MLKDVVTWSSNIFGMEWCEYLSGSFFGILYLYLWYNYIISISNSCGRDINLCGLFSDCVYCLQSQLNLSIGMVKRCFLVSSYMCATLVCVCMVCVSTFIFPSELQSFVELCANGMTNCKGMYLVSLFCLSEK